MILELLKCENFANEGLNAIPQLTSLIITIFQIAIPIILIVYGMLDMGKAVMANDEKAMKEHQKKFINRIVYAVLVFLIIAIVRVVFSALADVVTTNGVDESTITSCISCFVSNVDC